MIRAVHLLCAALALVGCTHSPPPGAQAALQAVLAYEAALPRQPAPVCVATRTEGMTFDDARRELREERTARPSTPAEIRRHQQLLAALETRRFDWWLPGLHKGRMLLTIPRVAPEQAESLSAATRPFIAAPPPRGAPVELGPIPSPLRAGIHAGCRTSLVLTAPAITGDMAFVESSYSCGDLCGSGALYALRPEGAQWRLIAIAQTWIA